MRPKYADKRKIAGYFNGTYVYSGKIKCGKCGRPYYHSKYSTMKHDLWECKGYREYGKKPENGCDNMRVYDYELDGIVKNVVYEFWKDKDTNIQKVIYILEEILSNNQYQPIIDKLLKDRDKLSKKKDKIIELYSEELISKDDFKFRNEDYSEQLDQIEINIQDLELKNKSVINKKERLLSIQSFFQSKFDSKDSLNDDIIGDFVKEIIINEDYSINITLKGDFEFVAMKTDTEYTFQNVTDSRSNRYSY
jgi:site-specific DNA recombinase